MRLQYSTRAFVAICEASRVALGDATLPSRTRSTTGAPTL